MRLIKIATSYNTTIHNLHKSFGNDQQKFDARLKLHKDLKLWSLYADMEETLGTFETCRAVYESILHSGISTPQIIINFAQFLTENNYFEESFRVFEKGLAIFKWPYCIDIWKAYLPAFIRRKRDSSNTERIRDLFEKCLLDCPNNEIIYFADMYAGFEIKSAFPRRAVSIYQRMLNKLSANADLQYLLYRKLLDMIKEQFGVLESREVYQSALETLQDRHAIELGIEFAKMEKSVGEVDRARSIFAYTSQMANPAKYGSFWAEWQEFEVDHGNDDTVREMLRIKRSIQLQFANVYTGFITSSLPENENAMEKLETNALHNPVGVNQAFVSETIAMVQGQKSEASHHGLQSDGNYKIDEHKNPEEIVLDDENDSSACETNQVGFDTNQDEEIEIEEKPVPNFFQKYTSRSQAQQ
ncbi:MAG: Pre-mRNA-splicing factor SYF1 [Marteilia pararefringens]